MKIIGIIVISIFAIFPASVWAIELAGLLEDQGSLNFTLNISNPREDSGFLFVNEFGTKFEVGTYDIELDSDPPVDKPKIFRDSPTVIFYMDKVENKK